MRQGSGSLNPSLDVYDSFSALIAARYPERISLRVVLPVEICMWLFYPITKHGVRLAGFFFRGVRNNPSALASTVSDAELRALINSRRHEHSRMLERVLEFTEPQVKDVMLPRMEVSAIETGTPFEEVLLVVKSTRYSRFPIYQGVLDNVAGILHGKDLMPCLHSPKTFRLAQLLRKPVFIPDTARLNNAVRLLQNAQTHLGIVVDEHGGVEGIVTLEDLIEQIVGKIQDEHDVEMDSVYFLRLSSSSKKPGKEMSTQAGSFMVIGSSENSPATANAIAMRWSPNESISPPRRV